MYSKCDIFFVAADCEEYLLNADINYNQNQKYSTAFLKAISVAKYSMIISNIINNPKPLEAILFMQAIMDECTHLKNFSVPFDTSLAMVIAAQHDAYIPKDGLSDFDEVWPGTTVKHLDAGHVGAYLYYLKLFR